MSQRPLTSLLCKRRKIRMRGKYVEADAHAAKINRLICDYRKTRLSHLSEAGPKELWEAVCSTSTKSVVNGNLSDPNLVNNHFATIAIDHLYNPQDVLQYYAVLQDVNQDFHPLFEYEIALLLNKVRHSSSGLDDLSYWLFQKCSFELAGIVTSILNMSFSTGTVPSQWLTAVVTPVPKKPNPTELSDYRPVSVTPIMSRLAEKIFVQQWLRPALLLELLKDQYAVRPTGSTCCATVDCIHHSTLMLENNSYLLTL